MPTLDFSQFRDVDVRQTKRIVEAVYTGPVAYVTGGDSLVPGDVKLGQIHLILFELAINAGGTIRGLVYDVTNRKVIWYVLDTGAEVANGTDLSGFSARFSAVGL